ncbi:MAG: hypothetical protein AB7G10_21520 [Reyranellaceae bacterium]
MSEEPPDLDRQARRAVEKALAGYLKRGRERVEPEDVVGRVRDSRFDALAFFSCVAVFWSLIAFLAWKGLDVEKHIALIVGLVLAAVAVGLTFARSVHTPLQRQIILALFALAGGAIATEIPGFLNITMTLGEKTAIGAGGAIAVFVVLYFFSAPKPPE